MVEAKRRMELRFKGEGMNVSNNPEEIDIWGERVERVSISRGKDE